MEDRNPKLTRHLKDAYPTFEEIEAAGEAVEQLLAHPGWEHLSKLVALEVAAVDSRLDDDNVFEQAEYALLHGRRGGLRFLQQAARAVVAFCSEQMEEQRRKHEEPAESGSREA